MLHSILATLLICLGMSNSGMPISNYIEENQELKLSQTDLQPKLESTTTTNTITLNSWDYTATIAPGTQDVYYQTWESKASFSNNAYSILADEITTQEMFDVESNGYGKLYYLAIGSNGQITMEAPQKYNQNNILLMLQITPYNINIETTISLNLKCLIPNNYAQKVLVETYSTEDNLSHLFNTQISTRKGQTILEEIYNINYGYMYNQTSNIYNTQQINNENIANITTQITLTPNTTNYRLINIYPLREYNYEIPSNWGAWYYKQLAENTTFLMNDQFTITNTNIIPSGTYEVVDIPGVMFYILTMPFTFVSQAFNLTLFVGTPYQINISNLFLAILAMLIFIWIIKLIVQKGG